jgi:hypothetical protein
VLKKVGRLPGLAGLRHDLWPRGARLDGGERDTRLTAGPFEQRPGVGEQERGELDAVAVIFGDARTTDEMVALFSAGPNA